MGRSSIRLLLSLALAASLALGCHSRHTPAPSAEGTRGMVATSSPLATEVGVRMLRDGGNAVDAAVAVSFALGVVEPWNSGVGGGAFLLVHMTDGRAVAIDGRESAPAKATRDMYLDASGQPTEDSRDGPRAIAVPGAVAALALAHERYGTKPWRSLLAPAIDLAREGFPVSARMAGMITLSKLRFRRAPEWSRIFTRAGSPRLPGARLVQPDLAQSYERIATEGSAAFYEGVLGRSIARDVAAQGGILTIEDLRAYRPIAREPVRGRYRGYEVIAFPPPGGGAQVIETLNLLERFKLSDFGAGSPQAVHLVAQALAFAFADRADYAGDPDFVKVPTAGLISKAYAAERGRAIRPEGTGKLAPSVDPFAFEGGHTTHFSIVDGEGNAVAVTQTINLPFGSGVVVRGTGIVLNDEMDDFSAKPGVPNAFGLVGAKANEIAPGKRPLSSMSPTILLWKGRPRLVLGSPGGPRIISAVVETIVNTVDFGMGIQAAVDARRFHHQWRPDVLFLEKGTPPDLIDALRAWGHAVEEREAWGSVQAVAIDARGVRHGGSDARSGGRAQAQ